jgi:hypothetical protein
MRYLPNTAAQAQAPTSPSRAPALIQLVFSAGQRQMLAMVVALKLSQLAMHVCRKSFPFTLAVVDEKTVEIGGAGNGPAPLRRQEIGDARILAYERPRANFLWQTCEPLHAGRQHVIHGLRLPQEGPIQRRFWTNPTRATLRVNEAVRDVLRHIVMAEGAFESRMIDRHQ